MKQVWVGIGLIAAVNIVVSVFFATLGSISGILMAPALAIGLVQSLYAGPWIIKIWKTNKHRAQGILIGAALTFLINSLCWGTVLSNFA